MYSFCAMYSFRMSFCSVPEIFFQSAPCFSATARYIAQMIAAGELMVIDVVTSGQRNLVEEHFHVGQRTDGHAAFADFALGQSVVGVIAHQRRQIERDRKPGLALREQIAEALVGVLGGAKAGELAHGPQAAAIHGGMNAARVGRLAGIAEVALRVPAGEISWECTGGGSDNSKW